MQTAISRYEQFSKIGTIEGRSTDKPSENCQNYGLVPWGMEYCC